MPAAIWWPGQRFPQVPATKLRLPQVCQSCIAECENKVAGLGKLRATALGWIMGVLWAGHGSWVTDHGCSERPQQERRIGRDSPSHVAGLDVSMVT